MKCCIGIDPRIRPSARTSTPSLASTAGWMPFGQRRLSATRPVHSSTSSTRAVADDVVAIAAEERLGVQRDVDGAEQQLVRRIVERDAERRSGVAEAGFGEDDRPAVLVGVVVDAAAQAADERGEPRVVDGQRRRRSGNHQRHARFVDQDEVGLVDDRDSWPRWTTAAASVAV